MTEPKPCTQYEVESRYLNDGDWPPGDEWVGFRTRWIDHKEVGYLDSAYRPSESEIQAECVKALRKAGAFVVVTSQNRRTRKQLAGLPDVLVFWHDHTMLLEFKRPGERMRPSQMAYLEDIRCHLGEHLVHWIVWSLDSLRGLLRSWNATRGSAWSDLAEALETDD
jgi:hypothetical protein